MPKLLNNLFKDTTSLFNICLMLAHSSCRTIPKYVTDDDHLRTFESNDI